ncbi:MAG: DUF1015 domain-containing protein [Chloroflexi bacterium]|nr:DUF1015 domain-containing protein [Chloroflexota bacterium]
MVRFRPFRGWRYNPDVVGDVASVLCPPYDMIGREMLESLAQQSPYNAVHLEGAEQPDWQQPAGQRYAQAADLFQEWRGLEVLRRDPEPAFYLLRHSFLHQGQTRTRLAIFGCVGLEEYEQRQVLPHEFTRAAAVQDRVSLMETGGANFSPIMSLYRDNAGSLKPLLAEVMAGPPVLDAPDTWGQQSTLWQIDQIGHQETISRLFDDRQIFLADGHHRYEAALQLRRKQLQVQNSAGQAPAGEERAGDYVMMALIEFDDPGLMLLPYHRVIGGLPPAKLADLRRRLDELFESQPVESGPDNNHEALLDRVAQWSGEQKVMGLVGPRGEGDSLLTLRQHVDWRDWGPLAAAESWILEEQVLKPVLGASIEEHVSYPHEHQAALDQVASGDRQMVFLLKPFPMDHFESIVATGQRLPSKSTFFFPKLPTGLVINQLEGTL